MSIDHPTSIAERVAFLGRAAGSLRRLDRAAGLRVGHSQQIAKGGKAGIESPQAETIDKIARATGATLVWLIRGEGRPPAPETVRDLVREAVGDVDAPDASEPPDDLAATGTGG